MGSRRVVIVGVLAAFLAAGFAAQATAAAKTPRLLSFRNCPQLLSYAKAHAQPYVSAYGFGAPGILSRTAVGKALAPTAASAAADSGVAAAPTPQEGVDYSGTNVQEQGVDEPDSVKTNGNTLFAIENNQVNSVDVSGAAPKLLDTLQLDNGWSHELLLSGSHLLVLSRGGYWLEPLPARPASIIAPQISSSTLTLVDVSDPSHLQVMKTLTLDGSYVDARLVGNIVRVVSSAQMPVELPLVTPSTTTSVAAAKTKNANVVSSSRVSAWLPSYKLGRKAEQPLVSCRDVRYPPNFSGLGMLTVTTIDLSKGLDPSDSTGIVTDGRIVYASPTTLFVATEKWSVRPELDSPTDAPSSVSTQIHAFDISDPAKTSYLGSGTVPGYLLNQWSMSEFQGVLRVVSTDSPAWWGSGAPDSQSFLTTLRPGNGALSQVGQVGGLGQGEKVYAVRMIGDTGYVVTFKQVDPLFTVDLHDPAHPAVLGQLDIPGYSAYLHPVSDNLLLGIGQNVDQTTNEPTGTQVSLFDVSDLKHPKLLQQASLGQGWSAAESDHHAFLYWAPTDLVVVPFGQQAVAMKVSRTAGISELGRIVQTQASASYLPQIERSVVVRGSLLTVSSAGVAANGLTSLAPLGWAAFPAPQPAPIPKPVPGPLPAVAGGKPVGTGIAVGH